MHTFRPNGLAASTPLGNSFTDTRNAERRARRVCPVRGTTDVRDNLSDGMRLVHDSGAIVDAPAGIPPNGSGFAVNCFDTESSLDNRSAGVGMTNCTGFDSP